MLRSYGQLEIDAAELRREKAVMQKERDDARIEAHDAREKVERYERFLRALYLPTMRPAVLDKADLGEWAEEQARNLLDGCEAECPNCSTPIHEGACVGEEAPAEPAKCRVCGCTDIDCRGCIERTGKPCYWVEADLCSACVPDADGIQAAIDAVGDDARLLRQVEAAVARSDDNRSRFEVRLANEEDSARLVALESYVIDRGALLIHLGGEMPRRHSGLAFGGPTTRNRSLRDALDQLRRKA